MRTLWIIIGLIVLAIIIGLVIGATGDTPNQETSPEEIVQDEGSRMLNDGTYTLDTEASTMRWTGSKTLIANYEDSGTIGFTSGSAVVEDGELTSGDFVIDMTTIEAISVSNDMPREKLTTHLKSEDFFDIANHPTSRFVVTDVARIEEDTATHELTGNLTVKGITQEITLPALVLQNNENTLNAVGRVSFNRADFDVRFGSGTFFDDLGDNVIDDMVTLEFDLYATTQ